MVKKRVKNTTNVRCKTIFAFIAAFIFHISAHAQHEVDSLEKLLASAKNDSVRLYYLNLLVNVAPEPSWINYNIRMKKIIMQNINNGKDQNKAMYYRYLAGYYNNEGVMYKKRGEINKAINCFKISLGITGKYKDIQHRSITYINLGRLHYELGDVAQALKYLSKSIQIYEETNDPGLAEETAYALNFVGGIYSDQHDFPVAMNYFKRAIDIFKKINNEGGMGNSYSFLGACYFAQHKNKEALSYFQKAIDIFTKTDDKESIASNLNNIGLLYQENNEMTKAVNNFNLSLEMFEEIDHKNGIGVANKNLGEAYFKMGDNEKALFYFKESYKIAKELRYPRSIEVAASGLYKVYKKEGKTEDALAMHEIYTQMHDSVNSDNAKRAALNNQLHYEYGKKQVADSIRAVQKNRLMKAELDARTTLMYLLFAGLALLILSGIFVVQRLRFMQKVKELKLRNKIAGDLHDEVGSALSSISMYASMAQMQDGNDNKKLVSKIEETSRETLTNMSDIVWSLLPRNDKLQDVFHRMKSTSEDFFKAKNVKFEFTVDPALENTTLNMEQRKNFYLVYKEAMNNAAKYSKATEIQVKIKAAVKDLIMEIRDNGIGFDTTKPDHGNGLYTMKQRAEVLNGSIMVNSEQGKGTHIVLKFKPA
ncbi:MAG TPA: tetratricopeptide repeat protein [Flavobacteriales bacterium]|nr:tetratricopeptide repeat protein [Flavobacteriales bacterium]